MSRPTPEPRALPRNGQRAIRPGDPATTAAALARTTGSTYSRFSLALVRHPPERPYTGGETVHRASALVPFLHQLLGAEPSECLGALFLDTRHRPIGHTIPFRGTLTGCRVEPRELLAAALLANGAEMVAFHNDPSGDPTPSPEDRRFARRLYDAAGVVGVPLRDFLVLGEPPLYWSFREGHSRCAPRPRDEPPKRQPKYRHPDAPSCTWAGTGFIPVWLRQEIECGASLNDFLVAGAHVTPAAARQEQRIRDGIDGAGERGG